MASACEFLLPTKRKGFGNVCSEPALRNARFNYDEGGMRCGGGPIFSATVWLDGSRPSLRDGPSERLVRRTPDADRKAQPQLSRHRAIATSTTQRCGIFRVYLRSGTG